jgi:hypothetical protein
MTLLQHPMGLRIIVLMAAMAMQTANGASLFGDPTCQDWRGLIYAEKRAWTNAFLAPLSLTFKGLQKSKEDKYNGDPKAHEAAIIDIDAFCMNHQNSMAADGAGKYLKKLFELPPN